MLERTLERSRALVSTRISIINSRAALAEKSRCLQCSERSKEVSTLSIIQLKLFAYLFPYQIVFVPCGHRALCQPCAMSVLTCPVCETHVTSRVVSYDA